MQKRVNVMFDFVQMQQAISISQLIRFGATMGIALAGQILVTVLLSAFPWGQQHILIMVLVELVWWPPFFCILYFSFTGVVKLVKLGYESYNMLHQQVESMSEEYEGRNRFYAIQLQEKERRIQQLTRRVRNGRMVITQLEPWEQKRNPPSLL